MKVYGVLPMAGKGTRLQPIGFSKELYPVISNKRHFAISEYLINELEASNVDEIKLVVNPEKLDIAKYYSNYRKLIGMYFYSSASLPESCLYPIDVMNDDDICLFGLPDTIYSPRNAFKKILSQLKRGAGISLGIFKVLDPTKYDSVRFTKKMRVLEVRVKKNPPCSQYVWGIWGGKVRALKKLKKSILNQRVKDSERLLGVGFNNLAKSSNIRIFCTIIGDQYYDIGTLDSALNANKTIKDFKF